MTAHTRSLFRSTRAGGVFAQDFLAVAPVLHAGQAFTNAGKAIVKGSIWIGGKPYNLDNRWATLDLSAIKEIVQIGMKDKTIFKASILSVTAGNQRGVGSVPGFVVYLSGSDEAKALAAKYSLTNELTVTVGRDNDIAVTHVNAIMCTQEVALLALGHPLAQIPDMERGSEMSDRVDTNNPDLLDLIQFTKVQGKLPERARVARGNVDADFAAQFAS